MKELTKILVSLLTPGEAEHTWAYIKRAERLGLITCLEAGDLRREFQGGQLFRHSDYDSLWVVMHPGSYKRFNF